MSAMSMSEAKVKELSLTAEAHFSAVLCEVLRALRSPANEAPCSIEARFDAMPHGIICDDIARLTAALFETSGAVLRDARPIYSGPPRLALAV